MKELEDNIPRYTREDNVENFVITHKFLTPEECKKIIKEGKKHGLADAEVMSKKGDKQNSTLNEDIRDSKIFFIEYNINSLEWFYEKIIQHIVNINHDYFNFDIIGFQEALQFTEYNAPHGHYDEHTDKLPRGNVRKLSMVIQLTDPEKYEGGDLELLLGGPPVKVPKEQGTVVIFPSYVLHRVVPTTKGTRHSLVGWVTGRPFR